jgi:hypothetical protein
MGAVVNNLISTVLSHSETVLAGMESTASKHGITLSGSLTGPWTSASNGVTAFEGAVTANMNAIKTTIENSTAPLTGELGLPWNSLTEEDGPISTFSTAVDTAIEDAKQKAITDKDTMQDNLKAPYDAGTGAATTFGESATDAINDAVTEATSDAESLTTNLKQPWDDATEAANTFSNTVAGILEGWATKAETEAARVAAALDVEYPGYVGNGSGGGGSDDSGGGAGDGGGSQQSMHHVQSTTRDIILGSQSFVDKNTKTIDGVEYYLSPEKFYYKISDLKKKRYDGGRTTGWVIPAYTAGYHYYAKGTAGTTRDEWAITDEPQFGDELVLVPGKDGNLSFMRKGTGVVPADLTQKLFELAQIPTSDLMNKNLTAIVPNVTKNDFKNEFNFESLVRVDTVDSDTLPKLEKMVDKKIDDFSRSLNYAMKKFAR